MSTLSRILQAIAEAFRGFFRMVIKAGKASYEWVKTEIYPTIRDCASELTAIAGNTARDCAASIPRMGRGRPAAPSPEPSAETAPIAEQQEQRQALLDLQEAEERRRCDAIAVRAGVRAVLRGQQPVGVPRHVAEWMRSLDDQALLALASAELSEISRHVDALPRKPVRSMERETPVAEFKAHLSARAAQIAAAKDALGRPIAVK